MSRYVFNTAAFALFIHTRRSDGDLPVTDAAIAAGVSRAQFFRAERGQPISVSAAITLCRWLGVTVEAFAIDSATSQPPAAVTREAQGETRTNPSVSEGAR